MCDCLSFLGWCSVCNVTQHPVGPQVEQPLRSNFQHLGAFLAEPSTQPLKLTDIAQSTMQTIQDLAFGNNKSDPNETLVYHRRTNVEIMRETILCLKPGGWLTDEIINIYMALLQVSALSAVAKGTAIDIHLVRVLQLHCVSPYILVGKLPLVCLLHP